MSQYLQDNIICSPYVFHHSPKIWDQPHIFRPSRFLQLDSAQSACFMPFSVGSRSCPGMKIGFLVAETLLKEMLIHFDVFIPHDYAHARSLRGGAHVHVRVGSTNSHAEGNVSSDFSDHARVQSMNFFHKNRLRLRNLSVNFELACSQLLPKRLVLSFCHQSKLRSLLIVAAQAAVIIGMVQFVASFLLLDSMI
jgi:hypothetical protein